MLRFLSQIKFSRQNKNQRSILDYSSLESRQLLAISLNGSTGDLFIAGTNADDVAMVEMPDASTLRATLNGDTQAFSVGSVQQIYFFGYDGNDQFQNDTSFVSLAYGGDGTDVLIGGSSNDTLSGGNDNDIITAGDGSDIVSGNAGDDILLGGEGNDFLYGGPGDDVVGGGEGNDFAAGSGGDDELEGGDGSDTLSGNNGSDTINGDEGDDTIFGGGQNDYLFGDEGNDSIFGLDGNDNIFGGDDDDDLRGQNGDDRVEGEAGDDILSGNNGSDTIRGGEDNDTIYGGNQNDSLYGDEGVDNIFGNNGDDYIEGGDDSDTLSGNDGADVIGGGNGNDNVYGGPGIDSLYGESGDDFVLGADDDDLIFGGDGADRLNGGDGNDRIYGEADNDRLFGGNGNDGLFGGIDAGDTIQGDAGSDRFLIWAGDVMVDRNELEAQIEFKNETSNWNEEEIQIVDDGLHWLMEQAGTSLVVRDSLDVEPVVYSKWSDLNGAVGINSLTTYFSSFDGYTYEREIQFLEWNENITFYNQQAILTTIHEVGHSWDSVAEINNVLNGNGQLWNDFTSISQWTDTNPNSFSFELSNDGEWWYDEDSNFAYNYGRTNPYEDWATVWEAAYEADQGENHAPIASKIAVFDELMSVFSNA